ncbi:MAG TPA: ATP-binding protein [Thermoleophilaceae bacterium]|nr:ATP-binding protein [Thermoleophilaceae bacterium]
MSALIAACGWAGALLAGAGCLSLRHRLERVARAEHELRGPVTVISLAHERGQPALAGTEIERLRAGLSDLAAARTGARARGRPQAVELGGFLGAALSGWRAALSAQGREARLDWRAGSATLYADRGRLAQALGNLLANAAEHGSGPVDLSGRLTAGGVRLEVRNAVLSRGAAGRRSSGASERRAREGRGRGLLVAAGAAAALGGRLTLRSDGDAVVAALDLPLERGLEGEPGLPVEPGRRAA